MLKVISYKVIGEDNWKTTVSKNGSEHEYKKIWDFVTSKNFYFIDGQEKDKLTSEEKKEFDNIHEFINKQTRPARIKLEAERKKREGEDNKRFIQMLKLVGASIVIIGLLLILMRTFLL